MGRPESKTAISFCDVLASSVKFWWYLMYGASGAMRLEAED